MRIFKNIVSAVFVVSILLLNTKMNALELHIQGKQITGNPDIKSSIDVKGRHKLLSNANGMADIPGALQGTITIKRKPKVCTYFVIVKSEQIADTPYGASIAQQPIVVAFPLDGHQPTTEEAAEYACANIENENITNWYVQAFGGDEAVKLSKEGELTVNGVKWGFDSTNAPKNIITVDTSSSTSPDFEKQFWETFRVIASDPVGRVLLYRILIEIRRQKESSGICEEIVTAEGNILKNRNKCRSIKIKEASDEGFSFSRGNRTIEFDYKDRKIDTLKFENNLSYPYIIYTTNDPVDDSLDIGLFHEIIHWFHYLRHPKRFIYSDYAKPEVYKYLMRSFYGDQSELCTWGNIDDEEIRTILGSPNYNDPLTLKFINSEAFLKEKVSTAIDYIEVSGGKFIPKDDIFLNGDDLSENVYRLCRAQKGNVAYKMRYSHGGNINKISCLEIPIRFKLAHKITSDCYSNITKLEIHNWNLKSKQAVQ